MLRRHDGADFIITIRLIQIRVAHVKCQMLENGGTRLNLDTVCLLNVHRYPSRCPIHQTRRHGIVLLEVEERNVHKAVKPIWRQLKTVFNLLGIRGLGKSIKIFIIV